MLQLQTSNPAMLVGADPATLLGPSPMLVGPDLGGSGVLVGAALFGVLLGSAALTGIVAWALHAHNPDRPKWKPALIIGGSSAVVGLVRVGIIAATGSQSAGMFGPAVA